MEKPSFEDRLLNRREASRLLGVSPRTLEAWIYQRKFDVPIVKIGRHAQHWLSDILNFIEKYTENLPTSLGGDKACTNMEERP